jgi:hypothetical protein
MHTGVHQEASGMRGHHRQAITSQKNDETMVA